MIGDHYHMAIIMTMEKGMHASTSLPYCIYISKLYFYMFINVHRSQVFSNPGRSLSYKNHYIGVHDKVIPT